MDCVDPGSLDRSRSVQPAELLVAPLLPPRHLDRAQAENPPLDCGATRTISEVGNLPGTHLHGVATTAQPRRGHKGLRQDWERVAMDCVDPESLSGAMVIMFAPSRSNMYILNANCASAAAKQTLKRAGLRRYAHYQ